MTIKRALSRGTHLLKNSTSANLDSEVLLAYVLQKNTSYVRANPKQRLSTWQRIRFYFLILKRRHRYPVAYLTHHKEFYGYDFLVTKHTLIPRPDTECIIEFVSNNYTHGTVIDIGTGSGAIAISLAKELPHTKVIATDISKKALHVAKKNATTHNTTIDLYHGNLWQPINALAKKQPLSCPIVAIANLPYLQQNLINKELQHEPRQALVAEHNGLGLYFELLEQIQKSKTKPNVLCMEILPTQKNALTKAVQKYFPLADIQLLTDLGGNTRYVIVALRHREE